MKRINSIMLNRKLRKIPVCDGKTLFIMIQMNQPK